MSLKTKTKFAIAKTAIEKIVKEEVKISCIQLYFKNVKRVTRQIIHVKAHMFNPMIRLHH